MHLLFITLFCWGQLQGMDNSQSNPQDASLFITTVLNMEEDLDKMYRQTSNTQSKATLEYLDEANCFKQKTLAALSTIIAARHLAKIDPLECKFGAFDSSLEEALMYFRTTLEKLFLAQYHHYNAEIMDQIDEITVVVTKKLYFDAQKFNDFTSGFIPDQIKHTIFTDFEKKAGLLKSQQHYCMGVHYYYTGLYFKAIPQKEFEEYENYEKSLENFCLAGINILKESWKEMPCHIQTIHKIVGHILGIKTICEQSNAPIANRTYRKYIAALLQVTPQNCNNQRLWETLSQTNFAYAQQITEENHKLFQQFQQRNK